MSQKTVFIIFDSTGLELPTEITAITDDPVRANEAKSSGKNVMQPDATVAASILHTQPVLYEKMDYATWQTVAEGMSNLQKNLVKTQGETPDSPFFEFTEPDLPASLAETRLKQLIDFPSPVNLPAQRELTEIIMADKHQQPVNLELFTEESQNSEGWRAKLERYDYDDLCETDRQINHELSNVRKSNEYRKANGKDVPKEDLFEEAQLTQKLVEADAMSEDEYHLINTFGIDQDEDGPAPG
ncbi:hypothetical protein [Marinobacter sp. ELB17]|uniref:hypothetical protein n=1 Tax=Marinobacter sp. ELB17 TaxID=270374 RepID=UPI0000F388C2|nr:hypothetical protein [Marinobacter sp. ELB17]EAZ97297.1 hypothetical protein MELB17_09563 [Marinobacter sp. ELB17]EAZ97333.1 hypothetical protein MELB17_09353 [Marinobacter sp. ELB17]